MSNKYLHRYSTLEGVDVPVIGVDFDGTIAEQIPWQGPCIFGKPEKDVARAMKFIKSFGYMIAIYTSRGRESYSAIAEYCYKHNIIFDYINENPHTEFFKSKADNKLIYDIYVDDKAARYNGSWSEFVKNFRHFVMPHWMDSSRKVV